MAGKLIFRKNKGNSTKNHDILYDNVTIRVILIGCLTIAISLLIMSLSSIFITKNAVVGYLKNTVIRYMAGSISASVDVRIEKAVEAALTLADDPVMKKWIESYETNSDAGSITREKMQHLIDDFGYDTAFLTSALSGNYWSCNDQGMKLLYKIDKSNPSDTWFFDTLQLKKRYQINIDYDRQLKNTYVWINAVVIDSNGPIGLSGVGMNLSNVVSDLIAGDMKNGLKNEVWLVNDKGEIYLSKSREYLNKSLSDFLPDKLNRKIINSNQAGSFQPAGYKDKEGEFYDVVYKKISDTDWNLVVQIPRSESLSFLSKITYNTLIACLLVILIVVLVFNTLSKRIADPYKRALLINEELETRIRERTGELSQKNTEIQDSIEYAKVIQKAILPSSDEIRHIFDRHFVIWEPRDTVGGDFYWIRRFEDGVLTVLGDCTGHGVPGALMTMAVNSILNHIVEDICNNDPAVIVKEMDRLVKQSLRWEKSTNLVQDGLDAGVLFISNTNKILFSGAQMPVYAGYGNQVSEIKGSRHSIGSDRLKTGKEFSNTEIAYEEGMALYMATDGLKDQPGGIKKLPYGKDRLLSLLASVNGLEPGEQRGKILAAYGEYMKEEKRRDDLAMIGIII